MKFGDADGSVWREAGGRPEVAAGNWLAAAHNPSAEVTEALREALDDEGRW